MNSNKGITALPQKTIPAESLLEFPVGKWGIEVWGVAGDIGDMGDIGVTDPDTNEKSR